MENPSRELVAQWCEGHQSAADEICERFTAKLIALAGSKLSKKLARRVDAEDVVQSAYRSFFAGARKGQYALERSGDLWRLLVRITLRKVYRQAARQKTKKRGLDKERGSPEASSASNLEMQVESPEPTPAEAATLTDELESILSGMDEQHRPILGLRLQGYKIEEIAAERNCSERTVRRVLDAVKEQMEADLRD